MRAAGWPLSRISLDVGVSVSTVQRVCRKHEVEPGDAQAALIRAAQEELIAETSSDEQLKQHLKELILDSVAHARIGKEKALEALEQLSPKNTVEAALTMRAVTAHATATKSYSDMLRQLLPELEIVQEELPTFTIKVMSDEDVQRVREEQAAEHAEMLGNESP